MQMLTKFCRKSEPILSFSYKNIITERTNMRSVNRDGFRERRALGHLSFGGLTQV